MGCPFRVGVGAGGAVGALRPTRGGTGGSPGGGGRGGVRLAVFVPAGWGGGFPRPRQGRRVCGVGGPAGPSRNQEWGICVMGQLWIRLRGSCQVAVPVC